MTDTESKVVAAWKEAASDLGIRFSSPFIVRLEDGSSQEYLGLVHNFGRRVGALISVFGEPSDSIKPPANDDYHWTILGSGYGQYRRQSFIDTLDDWRFFGPDSDRPDWYTGKSWGE